MRDVLKLRSVLLLLVLAMVAAACSSDASDDTEAADTAATDESTAATEEMTAGDDMAAADSTQACDTDAIVAAVEGGQEEGTLSGMADDPVGTAASNNPVLTTLVAAATEAGLVDTLNSAEALTVFAPTDCAFAALDPATLDAALADPTGLLTQVLGFHVIAGERLSSEDLAGMTELTTFTDQTLQISAEGDSVMVGGQASVVVPDISTANATVHLIDSVMLPPMDG